MDSALDLKTFTPSSIPRTFSKFLLNFAATTDWSRTHRSTRLSAIFMSLCSKKFLFTSLSSASDVQPRENMTDELHSGLGSLRTDGSVENTFRLPSEDLMFQVSLFSFTLSRPFFLSHSLSLALSRKASLPLLVLK